MLSYIVNHIGIFLDKQLSVLSFSCTILKILLNEQLSNRIETPNLGPVFKPINRLVIYFFQHLDQTDFQHQNDSEKFLAIFGENLVIM